MILTFKKKKKKKKTEDFKSYLNILITKADTDDILYRKINRQVSE